MRTGESIRIQGELARVQTMDESKGGGSRVKLLELAKSLDGQECDCGRKKAAGMSFCNDCFYKLSISQRRALYRPMGGDYEEAYEAALVTLRSLGRVPP